MTDRKPWVTDDVGEPQEIQAGDTVVLPAIVLGQVLICAEGDVPEPVHESLLPVLNDDAIWLANDSDVLLVVDPDPLAALFTDDAVEIRDNFGNVVTDGATEELLHSTRQPDDGIHGFVAIAYADEATRLAITSFAPTDVHKVAVELDTGRLWRLIDDDPVTWHNLTVYAAGLNGFLRQTAPGVFEVIKTNMTAMVDPTVNNDSSPGQDYSVGSWWFNNDEDTGFICGLDGVGAALWQEMK